MPQINLLSNETKDKALPVGQMLAFIARLFAVVFFAVIAYYGYLWYRSKDAANDILAKQGSILKMQNEVLEHKDRKELLARQEQLKELETLVAAHPYWSKLFPELARVTLKSAYYTSLSVTDEGRAKLSVITPNYTEFDNFLQVFNKDEFNQQFSNVVVSSVSKYQVGGVSGVKFEVELAYDTDFLKRQNTQVK